MSTTSPVTTAIVPLSQSRRALMACAHLYRARIIGNVPEAPGEAALRGTEIHRGAQDYVNHLVSSRRASDWDWFFNNILSRPYRPDALELLEEAFKAKVFDIDPERVLGTEIYLALNEGLRPIEFVGDEPGAEAVAVEGTLDRVDSTDCTTAVIHDYKSNFAMFDAEDSFQAMLYPFLLFKHYDQIETIKFVLHFVRYGSATRDVTYTRADLPEMEKMVRRERERQLQFHTSEQVGTLLAMDATPGAACTYCPLLNQVGGNGITTGRGCPIAAMNPYGEMSAEDRARYKLYLIAAAKENDRILKDFCDLAPVQVRDGNGKLYQIGFIEKQKAKYPVVDCLPLVVANDPELTQKLMLSGLSQPLKAKKRKELRDLMEPHKVMTSESHFKATGIDEEESDAE